jgi:hypothetical protein
MSGMMGGGNQQGMGGMPMMNQFMPGYGGMPPMDPNAMYGMGMGMGMGGMGMPNQGAQGGKFINNLTKYFYFQNKEIHRKWI